MAKYYDGPKQLLPVMGKPVIEHLLEQLPEEINELIFVVGGIHEEKIREHFKSQEWHGRPIRFVLQKEQLGLAHAFTQARDFITGRWMGILPDDIYGPNSLQKIIHEELALLAYRVPNPQNFGVLVTDDAGNLLRAVEKPKEFVSDLVWTGIMVMDEDFFEVEVRPSARGEYETPDVWVKLINEKGKKIKVVETDLWLPVNDKQQLEEAEKVLTNR